MTRIAPISRCFATAMTLLCVAALASAATASPVAPFAAHPRAYGRAAAQGYTITDLGTLPGQNVSEAGGIPSLGGALNSLGQAAGSSSGGAWIATLFSNGKVKNLNTVGASVSLAFGINNSGQLAGEATSYSDPCSCFHAFVYSNGKMTVIDSPSVFPAGAKAYGINNSGQVVGQGYISPSNFHAFLYSGGRMVDLGGGYQAEASAINDAGQVIGNGTALGSFLYSNGKMVRLGVPSGAFATSADAINRAGQIVGSIYFSGSASHAGLYRNGHWTDLGVFPGSVGTVANGINAGGQIVGTAIFPNQYEPFKVGKHVGLIFRNGAVVDLNTLLPPNSGFTITDVAGINDSGQIVGDATNTSGFKHAVLLTPK